MRRRVNVRGIIINNKGEIFCQKLTANSDKGRDFGVRRAAAWKWVKACWTACVEK